MRAGFLITWTPRSSDLAKAVKPMNHYYCNPHGTELPFIQRFAPSVPSSHPRASPVIFFWKHLSLLSPYFIIFLYLNEGGNKAEANPLPACEAGTKPVTFIPKPPVTFSVYFLLNSPATTLTQKSFWDKLYQNSSTITLLHHLKGQAAWRMPFHLHIKLCALVTSSDWGQHVQNRILRIQFSKSI